MTGAKWGLTGAIQGRSTNRNSSRAMMGRCAYLVDWYSARARRI
jgi:hypothetical protein